jgi:hypothetical protein
MPAAILAALVAVGVIPGWIVPFVPLIEELAPVGELVITDLIWYLQNTKEGQAFMTNLRDDLAKLAGDLHIPVSASYAASKNAANSATFTPPDE